MSIATKICGLRTRDAVEAAVGSSAAFVGFVFFPPSPRFVNLETAAELASMVLATTKRVSLTVNEDHERIAEILDHVPIDILQLHGRESPEEISRLKDRFGLPVIKAIPVSDSKDLKAVDQYLEVADWLLFDAKAPKGASRPGGNAQTFDWSILANLDCPLPWFLAGGITLENVAEAVEVSGTAMIDLSSAVEDAVAVKNPGLITEFLLRTAKL
jgi:phosphoribosylanthranilate isomerase